jgi:hypothetical protein
LKVKGAREERAAMTILLFLLRNIYTIPFHFGPLGVFEKGIERKEERRDRPKGFIYATQDVVTSSCMAQKNAFRKDP